MSSIPIKCSNWVLLILILSPLMPKIGYSEAVVVYPYEIALAVAFICFFIWTPASLLRFSVQKWYFSFVSVLFLSTLISSILDGSDFLGVLKLLKLFLYTSIPAIIFHSKINYDILKKMALIGIAALALNIYLLVIAGGSIAGDSLSFNIEMISGGLSGKFFNLNTFSLESTGRLSHGVWTTYFALISAVVFSLYVSNRISFIFFGCFIIFIGLNTAASISREGLLLLFIISIGFCFRGASGVKTLKVFHINPMNLLLIFIFIFIVSFYIVDSQIGKKLLFMFDYLSSGGVDDNIGARINTWKLTLHAIFNSPRYLLIGMGYDLDIYGRELDRYAAYVNGGVYSGVPESLIFTALSFGGIAGFITLIGFVFSIISIYRRSPMPQSDKVFFGMFLLGLLITNIVSGATAIADLVLVNFLIIIGIWYRFESDDDFRMTHCIPSTKAISLYKRSILLFGSRRPAIRLR